MKVKKIVPHATLPSKAHNGDLGYDLYAVDQISVPTGDTVLISTGIAIQFPNGYGGIIRDRSSVAMSSHSLLSLLQDVHSRNPFP